MKDYADYVYDQQNQLMSIRNSAGATVVGFAYDAQGNVRNKNGQLYDFDYGNRLRAATGVETYRYDGLGRRVQSTSPNGATKAWLYSQSGQVVFWSDWENASYFNQKTHDNIYLQGSVIATLDRAWPSNAVLAVNYQHTDMLGSPVAVTNASGQVTERNEYEPYGAIIGKPTRSGIGYTGHVMDGGTSLTYMQQRYYDQSVGRFLSVDPVAADPNSGFQFNRYKYALNNPYRYTDPDGRCESISTCNFDRDERAVAAGAMTTDEFQRRNNARGGGIIVGAGGLTVVYTGGRSVPLVRWISSFFRGKGAQGREASPPPFRDVLVGKQDKNSRAQGGRHNSGPLAEEYGGTGNAEADFERLTGGAFSPAREGSRLPAGSKVGDNGVIYRPGTSSTGPRIDIPANGDKLHETLHYPMSPQP